MRLLWLYVTLFTYVSPCFRKVLGEGALRAGSGVSPALIFEGQGGVSGTVPLEFQECVFVLCVLAPGVLVVVSQEAHTKASAFMHECIDVEISAGGDKIRAACSSALVVTSVGLGPAWPAA